VTTAARQLPATDPVGRLAHDLEEAVSLREMLMHRRLDRDFTAKGGRLCYAIDSTILHRYFADALANQPPPRLFEGPPDSTRSPSEQRVFDIITTDLVQNLSARDKSFSPLLILPGHIEETRRLHDQLIATLEMSRTSRQNARNTLARLLTELQDAPPSRQRALLDENEAKLHDLLYSVDESNEKLARFNDLLASGRLRSTAKVHYDKSWFALMKEDSRLAPILQGDVGAVPMDAGEGTAEWWQRRLDKMPDRYVERDKKALATLDRLNRVLRPHDIRVVLFTDNDLIVREGRRYRPFRHEDTDLQNYNFTDLYIRQPKAMLFEPEILRPSDPTANPSDIGWLDAFLSRIIGTDGTMDLVSFRAHFTSRTLYENPRDIAETAVAEWPQAHEQLHRDWIGHLDTVTLAHVATSSIARSVIRQRLRLTEEGLPNLSALEHELQGLAETSWDSFYMSAARSGYEMIGLSLDRVRGQKRNVPILFLRNMPQAERLLDLVYEVDGVILHEALIRELLDKIENVSSRLSRYAAALCYAILFAYTDRWFVAKALAIRAVEIATNEVSVATAEHDDEVSGREALFLACVTHRLTAKRRADLLDCDRFLARAREKLKAEGNTQVPAYPPMTGVRFDGEAIAIMTARVLFDAHAVTWQVPPGSPLIATARETIADAKLLLSNSNICDDERVRRSTYANARTNYFANLYLLECAGVLNTTDLDLLPDIIAGQLKDWRVMSSGFDGPDVSSIDMQALLYAGSLLQLRGDPRSLARVETIVDSSRPIDTFLMPYDRSRYERMKNFAKARRRG
jgi:hypothetical protein